ncbi:MAG TPA: hypothetical protein VGF30_05785 [Bacteroidia bacterium]
MICIKHLFHFYKRIIIILLFSWSTIFPFNIKAQNYAGKSYAYNALIGAFSGGVGSLINKHPGQKWHKAFAKGFVTGLAGGSIVFGGKKLNYFVGKKQSLGYAWLSRAAFSAGNSIIENAAANRNFWEVWHYDIAFVRIEFVTKNLTVTPRFMPSTFGGTVFMAIHGKLDAKTSLRSGTLTFRTPSIRYSPNFVASTPTNGILFTDTLRAGSTFYYVYGHEMIHTFQFQEFSACNYFLKPVTNKWENNPKFKKLHKWIYGDLNYEVMLVNYFIIQKGHKRIDYCKNFLENEAESLSTNRPACPTDQ